VQSAQALQAAFSSSSNLRVDEMISSSMAGTSGVSRSALAGVAGALVS
jgi:hypothetical protein